MKIREIRAAGLRGGTPRSGRLYEVRPDDCIHTLVSVHTDEGLTGYGSVYTNDGLVRAAPSCCSRSTRTRTRWSRSV
jgi:hypothetical protein